MSGSSSLKASWQDRRDDCDREYGLLPWRSGDLSGSVRSRTVELFSFPGSTGGRPGHVVCLVVSFYVTRDVSRSVFFASATPVPLQRPPIVFSLSGPVCVRHTHASRRERGTTFCAALQNRLASPQVLPAPAPLRRRCVTGVAEAGRQKSNDSEGPGMKGDEIPPIPLFRLAWSLETIPAARGDRASTRQPISRSRSREAASRGASASPSPRRCAGTGDGKEPRSPDRDSSGRDGQPHGRRDSRSRRAAP